MSAPLELIGVFGSAIRSLACINQIRNDKIYTFAKRRLASVKEKNWKEMLINWRISGLNNKTSLPLMSSRIWTWTPSLKVSEVHINLRPRLSAIFCERPGRFRHIKIQFFTRFIYLHHTFIIARWEIRVGKYLLINELEKTSPNPEFELY